MSSSRSARRRTTGFGGVQALLGREIPGGDPAAIFDRALKVLEAQVEKTKLAAWPAATAAEAAYPSRDG